ncbi:MAG TPA: F0F1 ATP synthase subunit B [Gemmatimonadales bacterium]|nr:F0F1 ATP synthase subunit B [Gemmatimonadales bacterium]
MLAVLLVLQEATQAAETGAPASPFDVNPGLIIWTWVVFLILMFVLKKFAWPLILKSTLEREEKIKAQLAESDRLNTEARAALADAQRTQAAGRAEAQQLLAEAKAAVEKEKNSLVDRVRHEQEAVMERARREIASERDKAISELRREAVDLAIGAAAKVIGQRLDSDSDKKIVLDYLAKVETH